MDLFPDGGFVRLQNRANGKYVHADEDWVGISLRPLGPSPLTAVWRVHHWVTGLGPGAVFLLLQGAAYGRYLAISAAHAPPGHLGVRAVQRDFDQDNFAVALTFRWRVDRVDVHHDYVRLRSFARSLRANGRHLRWNTGVSVDTNDGDSISTMMQWTVQAVAVSPAPIPLPATQQAPQNQGDRHRLLFWRRAGHGVHPHLPRTIWYVRADDQGNFNQNPRNWPSFTFHDHSVFNLRTELGMCQDDWNGDLLSMTLCTWPNFDGRLMPLVSDLPRSGDPMYIVVLTTGSPAAEALVYPQVDAPAP